MLQKSLLSGIISIALIANAIVFTVYINKQKDKTAKGVFIATCVYALISLGFKWFI
jgi:formate/nitrite transporter FocA (FNT family)